MTFNTTPINPASPLILNAEWAPTVPKALLPLPPRLRKTPRLGVSSLRGNLPLVKKPATVPPKSFPICGVTELRNRLLEHPLTPFSYDLSHIDRFFPKVKVVTRDASESENDFQRRQRLNVIDKEYNSLCLRMKVIEQDENEFLTELNDLQSREKEMDSVEYTYERMSVQTRLDMRRVERGFLDSVIEEFDRLKDDLFGFSP